MRVGGCFYPWMRKPSGGKGVDALPGRGCGGGELGGRRSGRGGFWGIAFWMRGLCDVRGEVWKEASRFSL